MGKRIYAIAKELNKENKEIIETLKKLGIDKKTASQTISAEEEEKLISFLKQGKSKKNLSSEKKKDKAPKKHKKEDVSSGKTKQKKGADKKKRDKKYFEKSKENGVITVFEGITIKELSEKMGIKAKDVIQKLITQGIIFTVNKSLSIDEATKILSLFNLEAETQSFEEKLAQDITESVESVNLKERPPVVTVMGHVDHGKTTLLDALRDTKVAEREKGGITQHIGASKIEYNGKHIVFIDTPGHEAFTKLRLRGANITDIVILIVAADDGVKPQTIEAINHAKTAGVPMIVAINKIDKPEADPLKVKQELTKYNILVEEYGGDVVSVDISAKKKMGLEELLDMILLVAEMSELKGSYDVPAKGFILEAKLDSKKGITASVIIQEGKLKLGDPFISGATYGKVRSMIDDKGKPLRESQMVTPVEITGFQKMPEAGETFQVVNTLEKAQQIAEFRNQKIKEEKEKRLKGRLSLDDFYKKIKGEQIKKLPLIIKADVQGSLEAIEDSLSKIKHPEVSLNLVHMATGAITEGDVLLASTTNAIIISYNVRANKKVRELAKAEKVEIRFYPIIYQLIDDVKKSLEGILNPIEKEIFLGTAEVRKTFKVPKVGAVAGCFVTEGKIENDANIRVTRNGVVVFDGKLASLKHYTKDVSSIRNGEECGIRIENFNDIKQGDILEAYKIEKIKQKI
jgi:translation initiation factor IF-2